MDDEFVSKTKRKQQMHELQALGAALLELPPSQLDALGLDAELARALREAHAITSHEARRRQLQYIGRLMREIDAEPIRAALAALAGHSAAARAQQRRLEQWRARLIEDDAALTEFAAEAAGARADLQALRALIRNARREIAENRPPRAQRELFRLLRESLDATQ
jgi:ribosome-associated protein